MATATALMTKIMSLSEKNGNGENTASLGGGGAAHVPEGGVCGRKNGRKKLDNMGPAVKPVGRGLERSW